MPEKANIPVYKNDYQYAQENRDYDEWRASHNANKECSAALDKAINDNYTYENYHLDTNAVINSVYEEFGKERTEYILAAHIVNHDWDGRFSHDVKDWAKDKFKYLAQNYVKSELKEHGLKAHSTLIDGVARTIISLEREKTKQIEKDSKPEQPKFVNQKDRVKEITDRLEAGIKDLFSSDKFKIYLNTMSKFHNYSFNNTMLIAMQKPDATLVASFNSWKSNFERNVNKGEKGIQILAPAPYKIKKEEVKMDPDTDLPVLDKDGNPVKEEKEVTIPAFKVVSVFDVSQTNGKEIPSLGVDELHGNVKDFEKFFAALKEVSPVPIKFKQIEGGAKGYYHQENKDITINEGMSEIQTVKTAIHEIAHAKLHDRDENKANPEQQKDSNTKEVEAESVAYTVCQHFGIDTSDYSFGYVASWGSGKDIPELKSSLETIRSTASELITAIEGKYLGLEKEQKQEQSAEKTEKSNIIGNTRYSDIKDKQYFKRDSKTAEAIAARLTELNIPFSGRINDKSTTLTIGKADVEKYKAVANEFSTKEKSSVENKTEQKSVKKEWRMYVIPDMKSWSRSDPEHPKTPIEYYNTFAEAKSRFDELRDQDYNSEKSEINGIPAARLTLGIDSNSGNMALDILQVRDNRNVLVDDFTRYDSVSGNKEAMALISQTSAEIHFDEVMNFPRLDNGKLSDTPEFIPFDKWDNKLLQDKPIKENLNIIGNTPYKDITDKCYAKLATDKALAIADILESRGVKFSGRTGGDKTTLTFGKDDMPVYKEALAEMKKAQESVIVADKLPEPKVSVEPHPHRLKEFILKEIATGGTLTTGTRDEVLRFCKAELAASVNTSVLEMQLDKAEAERQKQLAYDGKLPDNSISVDDRNAYGYTSNAMLPLSTEKALEYFDKEIFAVYLLYADGTEGQAIDRSDIENHNGIFGVETPDWEKYQVYQQHLEDMATQEPAREAMLMNVKNCMAGIYQLKDIPETREYRFSDTDFLEKKGLKPERENYTLVYTFEVLPEDLQNKDTFLDDVFAKFNLDHPKDFTGHSLSVSDVVVIQNHGDVSAHFVDSFGFTQLESFGKERENPLKAVEDAVEQNDNSFDVVINNQPTADELEAKTKNGEVISVTGLYDAVQREKSQDSKSEKETDKKRSILEYLRESKNKPEKPEQDEKTRAKSKGAEL